ncbi:MULTISPECIES: type II toxin-antitoxin system RelE/ParE family toxin [unclassified Mesorhizobium]|uniref:type II toxin-antitoxin system RelE/ParE family toxin n=1 Tax=unclassified Mesorhizobium TaxID=325217 RepID=UPI0033359F1E
MMEIALPYPSHAYRVIYAVQLGDAIWVVRAFQKKSTTGIATPKEAIDLIKARLKQIRKIES